MMWNEQPIKNGYNLIIWLENGQLKFSFNSELEPMRIIMLNILASHREEDNLWASYDIKLTHSKWPKETPGILKLNVCE